MTQIGEGVAVTVITEDKPPKEEKEQEKKKVKVRLCVSFDGTLNNRTNTESRKNKAQAYEDVKDSWFQAFRGYGSYENDLSNVAKFDKFVDQASGYEKTIALYIEGIGTINHGTDTFLGKALGQGEAGIVGKARKALNQIIFELMKHFTQGEVEFELVTLDLFGFSRGAATARHFVNHVLDECDHPGFKLSDRIKSANYGVDKIEVSFVGLYDTVSSFGLPFEHKKNSRILKLNAISFANKVVQLAAAEEHRENFSLTNIDSAGGKGKEVFLPGVHSDIGGGYIDGAIEELIIDKKIKTQLEKERAKFIESGWFNDNEIRVNCPSSRSNRVPLSRRICKLEVKRIVAAEYDRIPLQIMADFAREAGMNVKSKLESKHDVSDKDLQTIKDKLKSYAKSGNSKPEDWHSNEQWLRSLRNKHLHFSAHYNSTGMQPRFVNGKRKRLHYDG